MVRGSSSHAKSVGRRRSVSARNWLVPPSRASKGIGARMGGEQARASAARSPCPARRSRLLSAMSGSGAADSSPRRRPSTGASSSPSRGRRRQRVEVRERARGIGEAAPPELAERLRIAGRRCQQATHRRMRAPCGRRTAGDTRIGARLRWRTRPSPRCGCGWRRRSAGRRPCRRRWSRSWRRRRSPSRPCPPGCPAPPPRP